MVGGLIAVSLVLLVIVIVLAVRISSLMSAHARDIREQKQLERRVAASEQFMRAIADNVPVRMAYFDPQGRFEFVNQVLCERFGRDRSAMIGRTVGEITGGSQKSPMADRLRAAIAGDVQRFDYTDEFNGQVHHIHTQLMPDMATDGSVRGVFGVGVDVTHLKAVEQSLEQQTATLNAIVDSMPAMVAVWDADQRCRLVNRAFESWMDSPREALVGTTMREVIGELDYQRKLGWIEKVFAGETVTFEAEYPDAARSRHLSINYIPLRRLDGRTGGFVAVAQDITTHREENLRLSLLNQRDPLTGLLNRAGFHEFLINQTHAGRGSSLAVLYIDLDHFKPVNDAYGHAAGDELLREFGLRLLCLTRSEHAVARLGGDEFAIASADAADVATAVTLADKVVEMAREPFQLGDVRVNVAASVGVAVNADALGGWKELVAKADQMTYHAKAEGRGRRSVAPPVQVVNEARYG